MHVPRLHKQEFAPGFASNPAQVGLLMLKKASRQAIRGGRIKVRKLGCGAQSV